MLNDATGLKKIYLAAGYTDLRRGMDGLATIIRFRFQLDPYDKNTLFLREEDGPDQGTLMGRGWVPASLQETEQRCLQLATFRRRGVGNIPGTVYDADARA